MAKPAKPRNWFYGGVLFFGTAFTITAFPYGWMAFLGSHAKRAAMLERSGLMQFLDQHGTLLLIVELALLALATVGALAFDEVQQRAARTKADPSDSETAPVE